MQTTLGYKDQLRLATKEQLEESLNILPGHVTPFCLINDEKVKVNVVLDENMMKKKEEYFFFHPCENTVRFVVHFSFIEFSLIDCF